MTKRKWHDFKKEISQKIKAAGGLSSATFELTARCNLQCRMCYVCEQQTARLHEKSAAEWVRIAKEASELGLLYVLLTGGEVFLRSDFQQIYESICGLGIVPSFYSNATLIDKRKIAFLKHNPPERVGVTLYGSSAATYETVCGRPDAYLKAVRGIDLLLEAGFNLELRTTVVPDNAADYDELLAFADSRGLLLKFGSYISVPRDPKKHTGDLYRLAPKELARYLFKASTDYRERVVQRGGNRDDSELEDGIVDSRFMCGIGENDPWLTWDGSMVPCGLMHSPRSKPFDNGLAQAWYEMKAAVLEIPKCSECMQCSIKSECLTCPARLYGESGSYEITGRYLCELAKEQKMLYL